jgi:hypothetical protein
MLVVIGPDWLDAKTISGGRRLDDSEDFVRLEISTALQAQLPVIQLQFAGLNCRRQSFYPPLSMICTPRRHDLRARDRVHQRSMEGKRTGRDAKQV